MKYTLRHTSTIGTFEVINEATGAVEYRGPVALAARELARLNTAATPLVKTDRQRNRQEAAQRKAGGYGYSRSSRVKEQW